MRNMKKIGHAIISACYLEIMVEKILGCSTLLTPCSVAELKRLRQEFKEAKGAIIFGTEYYTERCGIESPEICEGNSEFLSTYFNMCKNLSNTREGTTGKQQITNPEAHIRLRIICVLLATVERPYKPQILVQF